MKLLNNILADLREQKLWIPVAALVAAIVAIPMVIVKPGEAPAPIPLPPTLSKVDTGPELDLTRQVTTGFKLAPHVNKRALDPFGPRTLPKVKSTETAANTAADSATSGGTAPTGGTTGGSTGGSGGSGGSSGGSTTVTDDLLTLLVTKGTAEPTQLDDVRTLSPLPSTDDPFLVYVGKAANGDASFLVSADVKAEGDGTCSPSPTDCRTLSLPEGGTETFTLLTKNNEQVQITVVAIETKKVKVSGTASRAAKLEARARRVGGLVLKRAIKDRKILRALARQGVHFR